MLKMAEALDGECRMVGGAVRDILRASTGWSLTDIHDYDFCTPFLPEEMANRLRKIEGVSIIPTGIKHGTITAVFPNREQFEITTLRRDVATDGRHAEVEYVTDYEQDAARRDFTINAMMLDRDGTVYDWFGGQDDLRNMRVQFVGDASERIQEDYLRILRWFRFAARFGWYHDPKTAKAIKKNAHGLDRISPERIWSEMSKFLTTRDVWNLDLIAMMVRTNVAVYSGLFTEENEKHLVGRYDRMKSYWTAETRYAYLVGDVDLEKRAEALKWSAAERDRAIYVRRYDNDRDQGEAQWRILCGDNPEWVEEAYEVATGYPLDWVAPKFPVSGKDLIQAGMKPGPEMGEHLVALKRLWHETGYQYEKADLMGFDNPKIHIKKMPGGYKR